MFLLVTVLLSTTPPALTDALTLVKQSRFDEATPLLTSLLYPPTLDKKDAHDARLALSKCHFYLGHLERARSELTLLLRRAPKTKLDTARTPPDFQAFFEEVKAGMAPREVKAPVAQAKGETTTVIVQQAAPAQPPPVSNGEPATTPTSDSTLASSKPTQLVQAAYAPAPLYLRWIPFGVGQFINRDPVGGAVWLSLSVALAAANVALAVVMERKVQPNNLYAQDAPAGFYYAQQITAGAFYAAGIASIVDALVWSPGRGQARAE